VGSEDEKRILYLKADAMDEFWRELKDTTQAQSSEIHGLKSVLMETFAWVEEAKSRTQQLNCPMYVHTKFCSCRALQLMFVHSLS
jgi:nuclear pore complex protein Nup214